jgi:RNA polymerase sigma-70 factor (ECF subfamily)
LHVTELDLVSRVRRGEEAAFGELVSRYSGDLFGLAYSLMGNAADAEDVVQQALLGAFRRIGAFEGRSSLKTWLVSILVNQASKARRSMRVRRTIPLDPGSGSTGSGDGPGVPHSRPSSEAVDSRVDVMTMLDALSPEHREVMVLRELQRMTYEEIAQALRIPRGTVESRLFRARRELKERFAGYLQ